MKEFDTDDTNAFPHDIQRIQGRLSIQHSIDPVCLVFDKSWESTMEQLLSMLAFALLIGGQFLAVIVVTSRKDAIYDISTAPAPVEAPPLISEQAEEPSPAAVELPAKAA